MERCSLEKSIIPEGSQSNPVTLDYSGNDDVRVNFSRIIKPWQSNIKLLHSFEKTHVSGDGKPKLQMHSQNVLPECLV